MMDETKWVSRRALLDFLMEAHTYFSCQQLLFLTSTIIDRYLHTRLEVLCEGQQQLYACAALILAAESRKSNSPNIFDIYFYCGGIDIKMSDVENAKISIAFTLGVGDVAALDVATVETFLPTMDTFDKFVQLSECSRPVAREVESMTRYIAEILLFHQKWATSNPSTIAKTICKITWWVFWDNGDKRIPDEIAEFLPYLRPPTVALQSRYQHSARRLEEYLHFRGILDI